MPINHNPPKADADPEFLRRVEREERRDGYRYGGATFWDTDRPGERCFIDISFYPRIRWWLVLLERNERRELTKELYARVRPYDLPTARPTGSPVSPIKK